MALYLWMLGRTDRLVFLSTFTRLFPCHFVTMTRRGHVLHFDWAGQWSGFPPFWYKGKIFGIRRSQTGNHLAASGRQYQGAIANRLGVACFLWGMLAAIAPLWILGWWASLLLAPFWPLVGGLQELLEVEARGRARQCNYGKRSGS